jgi:hypothetical protein
VCVCVCVCIGAGEHSKLGGRVALGEGIVAVNNCADGQQRAGVECVLLL